MIDDICPTCYNIKIAASPISLGSNQDSVAHQPADSDVGGVPPALTYFEVPSARQDVVLAAEMALAQGDFEEIENIQDQLLTTHHLNLSLLYQLGTFLYDYGRYEAANDFFCKILQEFNENEFEYYSDLLTLAKIAQINIFYGHFEAAEEIFLAFAPQSPEMQLSLARLLFSQMRYEEALGVLAEADPNRQALILTGNCQAALGNLSEAQGYYQQAAANVHELEISQTEALAVLQAYIALENYDQARTFAERLLQENPEWHDLKLDYGSFLFQELDDYTAAISILSELPETPEAAWSLMYANYGLSYLSREEEAQMFHTERYEEYLERSISFSERKLLYFNDPHEWETRAQLYQMKKVPEQSFISFDNALRGIPATAKRLRLETGKRFMMAGLIQAIGSGMEATIDDLPVVVSEYQDFDPELELIEYGIDEQMKALIWIPERDQALYSVTDLGALGSYLATALPAGELEQLSIRESIELIAELTEEIVLEYGAPDPLAESPYLSLDEKVLNGFYDTAVCRHYVLIFRGLLEALKSINPNLVNVHVFDLDNYKHTWSVVAVRHANYYELLVLDITRDDRDNQFGDQLNGLHPSNFPIFANFEELMDLVVNDNGSINKPIAEKMLQEIEFIQRAFPRNEWWSFNTHYYKAYCFAYLGDQVAEIREYETIINLNIPPARKLEAYLALCRYYSGANQTERARELCQEVLAIDPNNLAALELQDKMSDI
ncbi:MAG: hypothetical protein ABIA67_01225 [Candidatus Margulisiibacteriota bacterium]